MCADEKLLTDNPLKTCGLCSKMAPIWKLHLFVGEEHVRLAHNFCPSVVDGRSVDLCCDCKGNETRRRWAKDG